MNRLALLLISLAGCSSLVDGPCIDGYVRAEGTCTARIAGDPDGGSPSHDGSDGGGSGSDGGGSGSDGGGSGSDGGGSGSDGGMGSDGGGSGSDGGMGSDAGSDAGPDAGPTCIAPEVACNGACKDLASDADNCGTCGHECASGICTMGHCLGDPYGHIVAIGHDYTSYHAAARRVLVNAVSLGVSNNVAVAYWPGQSPRTGYRTALTAGMASVNRSWHVVPFPLTASATALHGIDVVVVSPEQGSGDAVEASATSWASTFDSFLHEGGVIVVLDGAGGQNYRFGHGAGLFEVGAPLTVTGQPTAVVDPSDTIADSVVAPYLAETSSVAFPNAVEPVFTTAGGTVVFHLTR